MRSRAVFLSLLAVPCWATAIAVIWTPTGAVIGADAKIRTGDAEDAGTACKVGHVGDNILWAETGILGVPTLAIDFHSIIYSGLSSLGTLEHRIAEIESKISTTLRGILNSPKVKESVLENLGKDRYDGLQFVIVAYDNGLPKLILRTFDPRQSDSGDIEIEIRRSGCPGESDCEGTQYVGLGQHETMDREFQRNPDIWKMTAVDTMRHLIGTAIKAHPESVGPPVAVAMIDEKGIRWLSSGACKAD